MLAKSGGRSTPLTLCGFGVTLGSHIVALPDHQQLVTVSLDGTLCVWSKVGCIRKRRAPGVE